MATAVQTRPPRRRKGMLRLSIGASLGSGSGWSTRKLDTPKPGASGIECVARLWRLLPRTQVIMLAIEEDIDRVFESLKAGATGYLVKHARPEKILEAVAEFQRGSAPMSSAIARRVVTAFHQPPCEGGVGEALTVREENILRLLAKGCRSKEFAKHLRIGVSTVNTHVRHLLETARPLPCGGRGALHGAVSAAPWVGVERRSFTGPSGAAQPGLSLIHI